MQWNSEMLSCQVARRSNVLVGGCENGWRLASPLASREGTLTPLDR
jgi:hypothetical protein